MTTKRVLMLAALAMAVGCQVAASGGGNAGASSPSSSTTPASKSPEAVPPECAREAQAAEHPSNSIEEREGEAHLKKCIRDLAEKREADQARAAERGVEQEQERRANAIRGWVRQWRARCDEDLSTSICKEAPKEVSASHVPKCGRDFPCSRSSAIGEQAAGGRLCGDDCAAVSDCEVACGRWVEARSTALVEVALKGCLSSYVEAKGKGTFACSVESPKAATSVLSTRLQECSKSCNDQGPEAIVTARESEKAEKEGPALALAYRRCMVAADSTAVARKYQAYDRALYEDLISKAVTACRKTSKCDWVERYSKNACDYSP